MTDQIGNFFCRPVAERQPVKVEAIRQRRTRVVRQRHHRRVGQPRQQGRIVPLVDVHHPGGEKDVHGHAGPFVQIENAVQCGRAELRIGEVLGVERKADVVGTGWGVGGRRAVRRSVRKLHRAIPDIYGTPGRELFPPLLVHRLELHEFNPPGVPQGRELPEQFRERPVEPSRPGKLRHGENQSRSPQRIRRQRSRLHQRQEIGHGQLASLRVRERRPGSEGRQRSGGRRAEVVVRPGGKPEPAGGGVMLVGPGALAGEQMGRPDVGPGEFRTRQAGGEPGPILEAGVRRIPDMPADHAARGHAHLRDEVGDIGEVVAVVFMGMRIHLDPESLAQQPHDVRATGLGQQRLIGLVHLELLHGQEEVPIGLPVPPHVVRREAAGEIQQGRPRRTIRRRVGDIIGSVRMITVLTVDREGELNGGRPQPQYGSRQPCGNGNHPVKRRRPVHGLVFGRNLPAIEPTAAGQAAPGMKKAPTEAGALESQQVADQDPMPSSKLPAACGKHRFFAT